MKIKLTIPLFFLLATAVSAQSDSWVLFKTAAFSAEFPKQPATEATKVNSAIGELKLDMYTYDASESSDNDANYVYMVMSTEYPDSLVNSDDTDRLPDIFRGGIDGAVNNVKGKLLSEKIIEIDGFPGREIKIDFKDGLAVITVRLYLVKNKMYMVQVITATENDMNKASQKFLNSFKLIK